MTLKLEDMLRLEALDAAVPRGWTAGAGFEQSERGNYIADEDGRIVVAEQEGTDCVLETVDRDLIVAMRNALPDLLACAKSAAPIQLPVIRDITAEEEETFRKMLAEHRQNPGPVSLTPILALITREEHERVLRAIDADLADLEPNDNGEGACSDPNAVLEVVRGVRRLIRDARR
jgi:hypothetical protein